MIDPALEHALRHLRSVKARQPPGTDSAEFARWCAGIAEALEALAPLLVFDADRVRARGEAEARRTQAAEIRRAGETNARADRPPAHLPPE